jgi:hypothetical protein
MFVVTTLRMTPCWQFLRQTEEEVRQVRSKGVSMQANRGKGEVESTARRGSMHLFWRSDLTGLCMLSRCSTG